MSFRQKATLLLVSVSLVCALVISAAYLQRSAAMNVEFALSGSRSTFSIIHASVSSRLNTVSGYYSTFNAQNVGMYLSQYRDIFTPLGVFVQLNKGREVLYSTFANPSAAEPSPDEPLFFTYDGIDYLAIRRPINLSDGQTYEFTVYWNVRHLRTFRNAMLRFSAVVCALSILVIGLIGLILMRRLTKPFHALGDAARQFAEGDYKERVSVQSKDEIGRFARTFNLMADAIERQIHEMDDLVHDREQFIDHLSHEIRTPITAMIGYSQVLTHTKATEADKRKAVEYIGQQSARLKLLSEKLLTLSRLRYDKAELKPVQLSGVIRAALETLHGQLRSKNIHIVNYMENHIDNHIENHIVNNIPDIQVMGDAVLLETLFQNLIENAIHASAQDGRIEISGAVHDKSLEVTIRDYGIGISEENLGKITEPFMRVDAARSRKHGGVGIGLALCKRICDIHRTALVITSALGQGTKIKIDFTIP